MLHYEVVRVLVVEDQAELADDIADGLRDQGMAADVAYDGADGIEKALMTAYDVVVLDRDLPRVHGDAVCATLAAHAVQRPDPDADRGQPRSAIGWTASTWVRTTTSPSRSRSRSWSPGSGRWPGAPGGAAGR